MSTLVTILHVIVCLFLMLTVLLQEGKGGGMGGAFGGANAGSVFGGAGASTFLRRLTAIAATVFMLTSMVLAFLASRDAGDSLEKYSNTEASRRKRMQEAEKAAYEKDAGVTPDGDAGVGATTTPTGGATTTPATGATSVDTGAAGATGAEVPAEIPTAGSATAPAPTTPTPTTPTTAGSAAAPTAAPTGATPPAAPPVAPVAPAAGSAHP